MCFGSFWSIDFKKNLKIKNIILIYFNIKNILKNTQTGSSKQNKRSK